MHSRLLAFSASCGRPGRKLSSFWTLLHFQSILWLAKDMHIALSQQRIKFSDTITSSRTQTMPPKKARVMLVDDHAMVRNGIATLVNAQADMIMSGEAGDVDTAIAMFKSGDCPDLVLIDLSLNGASGFELLKKLHLRYPSLSMLVVSMHDEKKCAERALLAGARGYVMKQEVFDVLLTAIRQVLAGNIYLSAPMSSQLLARIATGKTPSQSTLNCLTSSEFEILHLIGEGHTSQKIASLLHRSIKTIEAHRANIRKKLQLRDGTDLNQFASNWSRGQVRPPE